MPADAFYGVQTLRASENFRITDIPLAHFPNFVSAPAMAKKAAARANRRLGNLEADIAGAIEQACDDIIAGKYHDQFIVDMIQGGAGTSTNMNANEVIALNLLQSMRMMTRAMKVLAERCIRGITANEERCHDLVMNSIGLVTALNPYIGYENATRIAKTALESRRGVAELALEEGLLRREEQEDIFKPEHMTKPRRPRMKDKAPEPK